MKQTTYFLLICIFHSILFAQKMTVKDDNANVLMEVNDEGIVGSITLPNTNTTLSSEGNKLYNRNDTLIWNGQALGTGSSAGGWTDDGTVIRLTTGADSVGIGTTTPKNRLDVEGGAVIGSSYSGTNAAPTNGLLVEGNVGIGTTTPGLLLDVNDVYGFSPTGWVAVFRTVSGKSILLGERGGKAAIGANNSWDIALAPDGGKIGIGTTTPKNRLDVEGGAVIGSSYSGTNTAPTNGLLVENNVGIGTASPQNKLDIEGGAVIGSSYSGTNTAPSNGLLVEGNVGIGTTGPTNSRLVVDGDGTGNYAGSPGYEVSVEGDIHATGNMAINTSNRLYFDGGTNTYISNVSGGMYFYYGGSTSFATGSTHCWANNGIRIGVDIENSEIHADPSSSTGSDLLYIGNEYILTSTSDRRLKENIEPTTIHALELIKQMEVVDFDWKEDNKRRKKGKATGLIAQNVKKYLPQVVTTPDDPDSYFAVEYHHLVPYLIKAIQDQQKEIDGLKNKLEKHLQ